MMKIESIKKLKKTLIKITRTKENCVVFGVSNSSIKLLTRLRLNFIHLNEHKFRNNFNDTLNQSHSIFIKEMSSLVQRSL